MNLFDVLFAKKLSGGGSPFPPVIKRVTGNPIEFSDGADAPLVKCVTEIQGYQQGTGTPSPDNIRPIVAYTEGEIEVSDGDGNTTTHTTTYPSAIYRGSEDVVNGTETHDMVVVDLGDLTYTKVGLASGAIGFASSTISDIKPVSASNVKGNLICSNYETKTGDQVYLSGSGISMWSTQQKVVIADQDYADVSEADFKNAMVGVQLAYELATPTTSSVTPTNLPVKSLSGYNHIESSTGDMTIDYITDAYQNFVDTTERAIPSTRKGGVKAFDIFKTLDEPKKPEAPAEESEPEEKETEEGAKK